MRLYAATTEGNSDQFREMIPDKKVSENKVFVPEVDVNKTVTTIILLKRRKLMLTRWSNLYH